MAEFRIALRYQTAYASDAEFAHTLDGMWVTELAITKMEMAGFSTTTDAFIQDCLSICGTPLCTALFHRYILQCINST